MFTYSTRTDSQAHSLVLILYFYANAVLHVLLTIGIFFTGEFKYLRYLVSWLFVDVNVGVAVMLVL